MGQKYLISTVLCLAVSCCLCLPSKKDAIIKEDYSWPCPDPEAILPCTCTYDSVYHVNVDCSMVDSEEELRNAFATTFPFDDVNEFNIDNADMVNDIRNLTDGVFGEKYFNIFDFANTNLSHFGDNVLTNSHDTLASLRVRGNKINIFIFEALREFTKLTILDLGNNELTSLPELVSNTLININLSGNRNMSLTTGDKTFDGVPNLTTLRMGNIDLENVELNLFSNNTKLKTIYLNANKIKELREYAINPQSELTTLSLENNQIDTILPGAITGLAADCELNMRNNEIGDLEQDVWESIFSTITQGTIYLEGNNLLCGCDMDWISYNQAYWDTISPDTECSNGLNIHSLDPQVFIHLCQDPEAKKKRRSYDELLEIYQNKIIYH